MMGTLRLASLWMVHRAPLALALLCAAPAAADAETVVLMVGAGRRQELSEALALELAGRGIGLLAAEPPLGETPLARAASAQEALRRAGASAGLWVEREALAGGATLRAVGADGEAIRLAALPGPAESTPARIFALVAESLIDELVEVPAPPVTVRFSVEVGAARGEAGEASVVVAAPEGYAGPAAPPAEPAAALPPPPVSFGVAGAASEGGAAPAVDGDGDDPSILPRAGFYLEGGPMFAGLAAGGLLSLGLHVTEDVRVGVHAIYAAVLVEDVGAWALGASVSRVGRGASWRFDYGASAALVIVSEQRAAEPGWSCTDTECVPSEEPMPATTRDYLGWTAGGFIGVAWELGAGFGLGARLAVNVAQIDGGDLVPAPMAFGHVELPL